MFSFLKKLLGIKDIDWQAIKARQPIIIDVRSAEEFRQGHVKGAQNIPLPVLDKKVAELKKQQKPVVTCCASGMRSGRGASLLQQAGIEVYNGGPWQNVNQWYGK